MNKTNWIPFVFVFLGLITFGHFYHDFRESGSRKTQLLQGEEITVVTSTQDAEGLTPEKMDMSFLKNIEAYTVKKVKEKVFEISKNELSITSTAAYVENSGIKLGLIRLVGSDNSNQVIVFGLNGRQLARVVCTRQSPNQIPITYGDCARKIEEIFKVKLGA
jgi:hypothetical protein